MKNVSSLNCSTVAHALIERCLLAVFASPVVLGGSMLIVAGWPAPAQASEHPQAISMATGVIGEWQEDQHLYVKGQLGISADRLSELETWLDSNGSHWTVVLLQDASGEAYQAADGRAYIGMDAVEVALGHGLSNRTGFGRLEHPQSGEADGAIFVLYLAERKFSYFASDAQDRRSLGESHWVGELDRPAVRAMRGGGRIVDAVKDTVKSINNQLERAISREQQQAERLAQQKKRDLEEVRLAIAKARESADQVTRELSQLRTDFPSADGEMTEPPVEQWREALADVEARLNDDTVREAAQQTSDIDAQIHRYLYWFTEFANFGSSREQYQAKQETLRAFPNNVAATAAQKTQELLDQAKDQHDQGNPDFIKTLQEADQRVAEGMSLGTAERQRLEAEAARRQLIRRSVAATLAVAALVLAGVLWFLNRRRAPTKRDVVKSFGDREDSVRTEMDRVVRLFERSGEILGSREKIAKRGYEGTTNELCHKTFDTVDELLIMSNEVDRVMDEARELIHPDHWYGKLINLFSSSRYERGLNRISGEPLQFHENQGIPAIFDRMWTDSRARSQSHSI